jgi:hypothetical protein
MPGWGARRRGPKVGAGSLATRSSTDRRRLATRLGASSRMACSEVSIYSLVDTSRCVHKGHHPYPHFFCPNGTDQTLALLLAGDGNVALGVGDVNSGGGPAEAVSPRRDEVGPCARRGRYPAWSAERLRRASLPRVGPSGGHSVSALMPRELEKPRIAIVTPVRLKK